MVPLGSAGKARGWVSLTWVWTEACVLRWPGAGWAGNVLCQARRGNVPALSHVAGFLGQTEAWPPEPRGISAQALRLLG